MSFEQIYNAYFKDVYRYIRKLSGNEQVAEEITSETFFKAMRSVDNFRNDCDFRVWLCQIAKNTYFTYLKKQKKAACIEELEVENIVVSQSLIEERMMTQEQTAEIRKRLHTIPEPYKEVFMWRVFGELSFKQIGQLFNKSDNWACVTYHRATAMLKKRLEDHSYDE